MFAVILLLFPCIGQSNEMAVKIRILLADDDMDSLSKLYLKLLHKQFKTEATDRFEEIDSRISRFRPHLLLINRKMIPGHPDEYSKKLKTSMKVNTILMTEPGDRSDYLSYALTRPVDIDRLMDLIPIFR
jgi:DNA-binding response OmpR family regulator